MTALTDRRDRVCLASLALVFAGLVLALAFVWLQLVAGGLRPETTAAWPAPAAGFDAAGVPPARGVMP